MTKYTKVIVYDELRVSHEELLTLCDALSKNTRFSLLLNPDATAEYKPIRMYFRSYFYDSDDTRYFLLSNDERRKLYPFVKEMLEVSSVPLLKELGDLSTANKKSSDYVKCYHKGIAIYGPTSCASGGIKLPPESLIFDNIEWTIKAVYTDEREDVLLVSRFIATTASKADYVIDSMVNNQGVELLDKIQPPMIKRVCRCSMFMMIQKYFPYVDRIWNLKSDVWVITRAFSIVKKNKTDYAFGKPLNSF
jgi:hypothetical protein